MSKNKEEKGKQNIRVFVSYSMEDRAYANELLNYLAQQSNINVFTTDKLSAGEKWQSVIRQKLSSSDYFLVLLSPSSINSKWVQFELGLAWGLDKTIIPIITDREMIHKIPLDLRNLQVLDFDALRDPESINRIFHFHEKSAA
jgi:hypothetical protein